MTAVYSFACFNCITFQDIQTRLFTYDICQNVKRVLILVILEGYHAACRYNCILNIPFKLHRIDFCFLPSHLYFWLCMQSEKWEMPYRENLLIYLSSCLNECFDSNNQFMDLDETWSGRCATSFSTNFIFILFAYLNPSIIQEHEGIFVPDYI
jgi:hypothetical protein